MGAPAPQLGFIQLGSNGVLSGNLRNNVFIRYVIYLVGSKTYIKPWGNFFYVGIIFDFSNIVIVSYLEILFFFKIQSMFSSKAFTIWEM